MDTKPYYFGLDYLRALAMLLGIVLHGIYSFSTDSMWIVNESQSSEIVDLIVGFIHSFRMQFFFLLSGFFSVLIIDRYQTNGFLKARIKKIFLPFILSTITVLPLTIFLTLYFMKISPPNAQAMGQIQLFMMDTMQIRPWLLKPYFAQQIFAHLWFLWYLIWFVLIHYLSIKMFQLIFKQSINIFSKTLFAGIAIIFLLILATWMHQYMNLSRPMIGADTSGSILPVPYVFAYYLCYYFIGAVIYQANFSTLLQKIPNIFSWVFIVISVLILFPWIIYIYETDLNFQFSNFITTIISSISQTIFLLILFIGLLSLGVSIQKRIPFLIYLSQSSYFVYIIHLPITFILQFFVAKLDLPIMLKITMILAGTVIISYALYHFFVKGKWLGYFLGEKRIETNSQITQ